MFPKGLGAFGGAAAPSTPSFGPSTFGAQPQQTIGIGGTTPNTVSTFGMAPPAPAAIGGFGTGGGTFGATPNTGSTFGMAPPAATTTGGFGTVTGGAFGAFGATTNTGSTFGMAPSATGGFGTGGGAFGTMPNTGSTFGMAPPAAANTTTGGFGGATPNTGSSFGIPPTTGFAGFGTTTNSSPATTSNFGLQATAFGTPSSTTTTTTTNFSGFGQTQPNNTSFGITPLGGAKQQFGFGQAPPPTTTTTATSFGTSFGAPQQTQVIGEMFEGEADLRQILFAYAPLVQTNAKNELVPKDKKENTQSTGLSFANSQNDNYLDNEQCAFDAIMFDEKTQNTVDNKGRWPKHWEKNPDPENLVQVKISGIEKLVCRKKEMEQKVQKLKGEVKSMTTCANEAELKLKKYINSIQQMKMKQAKLYNRLFSVLRKVEVLRLHKVPILRKELEFRDRLERIKAGISEPYTKIQMLLSKQAQEEQEHHTDNYASVENQSDIEKILIHLKYQREGLEHLSKILEKDISDIKIISDKINSN